MSRVKWQPRCDMSVTKVFTTSFTQPTQNSIHTSLVTFLQSLSARYKYGSYAPMATIAPTLRMDLLTLLSVIILFVPKLTRAFEGVQRNLSHQYANAHSSSCPNIFQHLKIGNLSISKFFRFRGSVTKQGILNIPRFFSNRISIISLP